MSQVIAMVENISTITGTTSTDKFITNISYDVDGNAEYVGKAYPGTGNNAAGWLIIKLTYVGGKVTATRIANGDSRFDKIWDNRATLSYS